jgi:pSer/pThr/pTyr-binding forkhead associated (FHA) protein
VSRRHARLLVRPDGTVLEDFGSKNGTYRGVDRVTTPIQLADGDELRIGSQMVTVRLRHDSSMDTQTVDM